MISNRCILFFSAALLCIGASSYSQKADSSQWGSFDRETRVLTVTGIGAPSPDHPEAARRPNAIRAAQIAALRNALEMIKGVTISADINREMDSSVVKSYVEGYIENFKQVGGARYMSDGTVEITVRIPLEGLLADLKLPGETRK